MVVLPTPPLPQQTMIGCSAASSASGPRSTRHADRQGGQPGGEGVGQDLELRPADVGREQERQDHLGQVRSRSASRVELLLLQPAAAGDEVGRPGQVLHLAVGDGHAGLLGRRPDLLRGRQPVEGPVGIDAVDHQRAERQPDPVE